MSDRKDNLVDTSGIEIDNQDNVEVFLVIEEDDNVIVPFNEIKVEVKEEPLEIDEHTKIGSLSPKEYDCLKYEIEIHNEQETSKSVSCATCWKELADDALKEHEAIHLQCKKVIEKNLPKIREKTFLCEICNKSLRSRKSSLTHLSHRRIHYDEKPYSCDICDASFNQCHVLENHKQIHTRENPYGCDICNASFSDKNILKTHRRQHTGEENLYFCDICNITFIQEDNDCKRLYTCTTCNMTFILKDQFTAHKRTHRYEKPFACDVCDNAYFLEPNLKAHKRTHET